MPKKERKQRSTALKKRRPTRPGKRGYIHLAPGVSVTDKNLLFSHIVGPDEICVLENKCLEIRYRWKVKNPNYDSNEDDDEDLNPKYIYVTDASVSNASEDSETDTKKDIQDVYLLDELGESCFFESTTCSVDEYQVQVGSIEPFSMHYQYSNRLYCSDAMHQDMFEKAPRHIFTATDEKSQAMTDLQNDQFDMFNTTESKAIPKVARFTMDGQYPFNLRSTVCEALEGSKLDPRFKRPVSFLPKHRIQIRLSRRSHVAEEVLQRKNVAYQDYRTQTASTAHYREFHLEILDVKIAIISYPIWGGNKIPRDVGLNYMYAPFMNRAGLPAQSAHIEIPLLIRKHSRAVFIAFYPNTCLFFDSSLNRPIRPALLFPLGLTSLRFNMGSHHGLFQDEWNDVNIVKKAHQASSNITYFNWLKNHNLAPFQFSDMFDPTKSEYDQSYVQGIFLDLQKYSIPQDTHLNVIATFQTTQLSPSNTSLLYSV